MTQKFHAGDLVHVVADLGQSMQHFDADIDAIVIGSYADQFGGSQHDSYTLHLKGRGRVSWYEGHQLTLIEANRPDLLLEWTRAETIERERVSDLDWIFAQTWALTDERDKLPPGASVIALAACLGFTENDLWGARGEGITFYERSMQVLGAAWPFLDAHDKDGWLKWSDGVKAASKVSR